MLSDTLTTIQSGQFLPEIHLPGTARLELLNFIANELPRWRDNVDRKTEIAETVLTDQLCSYLNSAARVSDAWSRIQFRTEVRDETNQARTVDLAPKPCASTIFIEGRRHTQFDQLLPIECKRLPTPKEKGRDEREYVVTDPGTTGGVQRFKFGYHGAKHQLGAMIGYVQEQAPDHWEDQVNKWILELSADETSGWNVSDSLKLTQRDSSERISTLHSHHERGAELGAIDLHHLWIEMN